jgi:hypothetical protein
MFTGDGPTVRRRLIVAVAEEYHSSPWFHFHCLLFLLLLTLNNSVRGKGTGTENHPGLKTTLVTMS